LGAALHGRQRQYQAAAAAKERITKKQINERPPRATFFFPRGTTAENEKTNIHRTSGSTTRSRNASNACTRAGSAPGPKPCHDRAALRKCSHRASL
jgi:hypothetical protein